MSIIPKTRPLATRQQVVSRFPAGTFKPGGIYVVGWRGYRSKTMGPTPGNDRGLYDDMICIVTDNVFLTFNANCDPQTSTHKDGAPTILPGVYPVYQLSLHNGKYFAICQRAGAVNLRRDKLKGQVVSCANCGINIHEGGTRTTGSEGCQTIPPPEWPEFITVMINELIRVYGVKEFHRGLVTYCVTEQ